jgi:hypothetical protein
VATATISKAESTLRDDLASPCGDPEFYPPVGTFCALPDFDSLPSDQAGADLAVLFFEQPGLADRFGNPSIESLPFEARKELLAKVKLELGIRPFRRKHLGYVGPK